MIAPHYVVHAIHAQADAPQGKSCDQQDWI